MQTTAIRTVANSLPQNEVILLTLLISKRYIPNTDLRKIAGIIKANTFGGKEVFYVSQRGTICFPYAKRTVPHRET